MKSFPTSSTQRGIYLAAKTANKDTVYNIPFAIEINQEINKEPMGVAIDKLIERYEILRSTFEFVNGEVIQKIHDNLDYKKEYKRISEEELNNEIELFIKPFDLNRFPLFRIKLLKLRKDYYILLFDFHSMIFDIRSKNILISDLFDLYNGKELGPVVQYKDIIAKEQTYIGSKEFIENEKFWLDKLDGEQTELELPYCRKKEKKWDFEGNRFSHKLKVETVEGIRQLEKKYDVSKSTIMLTGCMLLLSKYSRQDDITIGVETSGQAGAEPRDNMIGSFSNILPFRTAIENNVSFIELLSIVQNNVSMMNSNNKYPFTELVNKLEIKAEAGKHPMYDTVFNYTVLPDRNNIKLKALKSRFSRFDISFMINESAEGFEIDIEYKKNLFHEPAVSRMMGHYIKVLDTVIECPDTKLQDLEIITKPEIEKILHEFNNTDASFPLNKTLVELFEDAARKYPDNIAVVYKDSSITYRELNNKVNQLAHLLREKGVGRETRVAGYLYRSIEVIIGMLSVLKAGGAYVPIDSKYPRDRIDFMLEDSNSVLLLSQKDIIEESKYDKEYLDIFDPEIFKDKSVDNPEHINESSDLACLIYTSGSTGKPKGAMLEHKNLVNFSCWYKNKRNIKANENIAEHSSFSFDAAIMGVYPVLFSGATIHILAEEIRLSLKDINDYFNLHQIRGCFFTTLLGEQYLENYDNSSLRFVEVGGEKLKKYVQRSYKFINGYGPTESTVYVTDFEVDKTYDNIPIGKPLSNVKIYIVDNGMNLCPVGIPGELCISGESLGRGYHHRPDITKEKFIDNPFISDIVNPGRHTKLYKTGDLARWLPDGNIEVIGRIDFQVKISGYRIELGEIESKLIELPNIKNAAVLALDGPGGNKFICAYYIAECDVSGSQIKKMLQKRLPEYMVPKVYVPMTEFPFTRNGKINRKELPEPDMNDRNETEYLAPRNDWEAEIAELWAEVLGIKKIGINDDFFERGGSSIKAVSLVSKMQKYLNISVADMFKYPTIAEMVEKVEKVEDNLEERLKYIRDRVHKVFEECDEQCRLIKEKKILYDRENDKYDSMDLASVLPISNVLLTGATGYLGIHVLKELMINSDKTVYCIIRANDTHSALERLYSKIKYYCKESFIDNYSDRIKIFKGDLSEDKLGLSETEYAELTNNIQSIIHTAANVSHYGDYTKFYKSNVVPVINLLELAKNGTKKDVHYISTRSTCEFVNIPKKEYYVLTDYDDVSDLPMLESVYVKSKTEGEKIIIEARKEGINTSIYRIGNLIFNSETGKHQENIDDNAFYNLLKAYLNIGYIPNLIDDEEMSYIDDTAQGICMLFDKKNLQNEIFHVYNPYKGKLTKLLTDSKLGIKLKAIDFEGLIDFIHKNHDKNAFKKQIENLMLHLGWLDNNQNQTQVTVFIDKTVRILKKLGFDWQKIKAEDFTKTIKMAFAEKVESIKQFEIMYGASDDLIYEVVKKTCIKEVSYDEAILSEGVENNKIYFILEGMLTESKKSYGGWEGVLRFISKGAVLGIENITGTKKAGSRVESMLKDTVFFEIDISDFREIMFKNKHLFENVLYMQLKENNVLKRMIVALN